MSEGTQERGVGASNNQPARVPRSILRPSCGGRSQRCDKFLDLRQGSAAAGISGTWLVDWVLGWFLVAVGLLDFLFALSGIDLGSAAP